MPPHLLLIIGLDEQISDFVNCFLIGSTNLTIFYSISENISDLTDLAINRVRYIPHIGAVTKFPTHLNAKEYAHIGGIF